MSETTKDTTAASADGNDVSARLLDQMRDINGTLMTDVLPGVQAVCALTHGQWNGSPHAEDRLFAIEWIAERLASEVTAHRGDGRRCRSGPGVGAMSRGMNLPAGWRFRPPPQKVRFSEGIAPTKSEKAKNPPNAPPEYLDTAAEGGLP